MRAIEKENHVCGWCGRPPACSSSRTSSPVDSQLCGFATKCSDPSFRTPSACRCSCWLFHWKHIWHMNTFVTEIIILSRPQEPTECTFSPTFLFSFSVLHKFWCCPPIYIPLPYISYFWYITYSSYLHPMVYNCSIFIICCNVALQ